MPSTAWVRSLKSFSWMHGDISNIAEIAREEDLSPPAVIVIGEVTESVR